METLSSPLKKLSSRAMAGAREIPRHGRRSATGKIVRVVQRAWNRMVACRQPRIQVGAMKVILTTSKAGMMCRAVVSAMTTAAGWAVLGRAVIPRRSLPTRPLFGVAGLQEPRPSIPQVERFSPGTSTSVRVRVRSRRRQRLQRHRMFLVHPALPGPSKSWVSCEPLGRTLGYF